MKPWHERDEYYREIEREQEEGSAWDNVKVVLGSLLLALVFAAIVAIAFQLGQ